jgi:hypothetical protein
MDDLEIGQHISLLLHEDDLGCIGGNGQDHVEVGVGPCCADGFLRREINVIVEEVRHLN